MSEHTPLPWTLTQRDSYPWTYEITDASGFFVHSEDLYARSSGVRSLTDAMDGSGFGYGDERANVVAANAAQRARLELIVRSVNLLPELVEALREARMDLDNERGFSEASGDGDTAEYYRDRLATIDALIAKATA